MSRGICMSMWHQHYALLCKQCVCACMRVCACVHVCTCLCITVPRYCSGGVGFDINCGVRLIRTNLSEKDVQPIKEQLAQVRHLTTNKLIAFVRASEITWR